MRAHRAARVRCPPFEAARSASSTAATWVMHGAPAPTCRSKRLPRHFKACSCRGACQQAALTAILTLFWRPDQSEPAAGAACTGPATLRTQALPPQSYCVSQRKLCDLRRTGHTHIRNLNLRKIGARDFCGWGASAADVACTRLSSISQFSAARLSHPHMRTATLT